MGVGSEIAHMSDPFKLHTPINQIRNFTNREKEQDTFRRILNTPKDMKLPLLHFWGVGGTGKTWLLKKLRENIHGKLPTAWLDLEELTNVSNPVASALAVLRLELAEFPMPRFDMALGWYLFKIRFSEKKPVYFGSHIGGLATELAEALLSIPLLGKALRGVGNRAIAKKSIRSVMDEFTSQQFYSQCEAMTDAELRKGLCSCFIDDLSTSSVPESVHDDCRGFAPKAVVFLDTLEHLRTTAAADPLIAAEEWVFDLHRPNSPLLLVTAGRDQLRWGERYPEYKTSGSIEQHLVGGLSRSDAIDFLKNWDITDQLLVEAILNASRDLESGTDRGEYASHPFSLGLCADTAVSASKNMKPLDPATFDLAPGQYGELARRFLKSLPTAVYEDWVRDLAATPRFDEAAARTAFSEHRSVEQNVAWSGLLRYSFVQQTEEPGWFTFHGKMRVALTETDPNFLERNTRWRDYWKCRSEKDTDDSAALAWYHFYKLNCNEGIHYWVKLAEKLKLNKNMSEHLGLLNWLNPLTLYDLHSPESRCISL
jgi:hypothetical protein